MKKRKTYGSKWRSNRIGVLQHYFETLPSNLYKVKVLNSKYDRSDKHLYSYDSQMVRAKIQNLQIKIGRGKITKSVIQQYEEFVKQANLIENNPTEYISREVDIRKKEFIKNLREMGLDKDVKRSYYLFSKLSREETDAFFTSDMYQAPSNDWESESWRMFYSEYGSSVQLAKLEDWIKQHTNHKDIRDTFNFYSKVDNDKRYKR